MSENGGHSHEQKHSLDLALDRMVSVAAAANRPDFIPSSTWQGSREGYYFGTSGQGTGYYIDKQQQQTPQEQPTNDRPAALRKRKRVTGQDLLAQAERDVDPDSKIIELTSKGVKSACGALRKLLERNQLQRAKYADTPEQFMESELALHQQISAFTSIAADSTLYSVLLEQEVMETLLSLLSHDNSDVALTVVKVLVEWIDSTIQSEAMQQMALAIQRDELLKWSIANLGRLDPSQEEEAAGIEDILTLVENLVELDLLAAGTVKKKESVAAHVVKETSLVPWLFSQIETRQSGRAAEVLSLLFQQPEVHSILPDLTQIPPYSSPFSDEETTQVMDGMEVLLQAIAIYRKTQPPTEEECDFLENVCLTLASALTFSDTNIDKFVDAQGIELVLRCLKEKVHAGGVALKLLDLRSRRACEHVVEAGGFRYLFPLFMGRSIPKPMSAHTKKQKKEWMNMLETHTIEILYNLTRFLTPQSKHDAMERFLVKFVESECEKCHRLVELVLKYDEKTRHAEYHYYRTNEEDNELAAFAYKLNHGGDLWHRVAAIAAFVCVGSKTCHRTMLEQLTLQKSGIGVIKAAVEEFASVLDDGDQKEQLLGYLQQI